jgi:hypothetical protein
MIPITMPPGESLVLAVPVTHQNVVRPRMDGIKNDRRDGRTSGRTRTGGLALDEAGHTERG